MFKKNVFTKRNVAAGVDSVAHRHKLVYVWETLVYLAVIENSSALCRFEHGGFNIIYLVCTNIVLTEHSGPVIAKDMPKTLPYLNLEQVVLLMVNPSI